MKPELIAILVIKDRQKGREQAYNIFLEGKKRYIQIGDDLIPIKGSANHKIHVSKKNDYQTGGSYKFTVDIELGNFIIFSDPKEQEINDNLGKITGIKDEVKRAA